MPRIFFHDSNGERNELEVPIGHSLMETALDNGIAGIVAECAGACVCATCHTYVAEDWFARLPVMSEMEDSLLDVVQDRRANSRLACQIKITAALDGFEVQVADNES